MRDSILAVTILAAALLACGQMTVRSSFQQYALNRAAFEMECPREKIQLVALNVALENPAYVGSQVGAVGCGKKGTYVLTHSGWVLNSAK
ncbi:MAG: hypothetical protein HYV09_40390 [Deltaproteobacteria bacterium]|nr:hypothetical protein [Deltaproteobacteria bacterium]